MQPAALVFWRTLLASALFFLFCGLLNPQLLRLPRRQAALALGAGSILGLHWLCFFGAITVSNVSVGLAGFAATSLFTALLEPLLHRRRPEVRKVSLALLVAIGIALIACSKTDVPHAMLGLSFALVGALLAAIYSTWSKSLVTLSVPGPTLMLYQMPASCLVSFLAMLALPIFPWEAPQTSDWPPLLVLSVICTFVAYLWFAHLLKHVTAYTVNLTINFEPVYGMLMAAALFREYEALTPLFYLGTSTIIAANILHAKQPDH